MQQSQLAAQQAQRGAQLADQQVQRGAQQRDYQGRRTSARGCLSTVLGLLVWLGAIMIALHSLLPHLFKP
jgi:hypothetical protein